MPPLDEPLAESVFTFTEWIFVAGLDESPGPFDPLPIPRTEFLLAPLLLPSCGKKNTAVSTRQQARFNQEIVGLACLTRHERSMSLPSLSEHQRRSSSMNGMTTSSSGSVSWKSLDSRDMDPIWASTLTGDRQREEEGCWSDEGGIVRDCGQGVGSLPFHEKD